MPLPSFDPAQASAQAGPPNPMGGPTMGGGAPNLPVPPPPAVQVNSPQPPQDPNQIHDSLVGRAFKALSGQTPQYSVDPKTGQTVQTEVPNTPGQFFKNVVAAALVGGAMGADKARQNGGSGLSAAFQGGQANITRDQQLNQQRIEQAQQQFKNEQSAQQSQREATEAPLREQLLKAQIAGENRRQFQEETAFQNQTHQYATTVADQGKIDEQAFTAVGAKPAQEGITSEDLQKFIASNPGAAAQYKAVPIDVKYTTVKGPDGTDHLSWENVYNLYKLDQPLAITKDMLASDKYQALKKEDPGAYDILSKTIDKNGNATLPLSQYLATNRAADAAYQTQEAKQKLSLSVDELKARISAQKTEQAKAYADLGLISIEKQMKQLDLDDRKLVDGAELALQNNGQNPADKDHLQPWNMNLAQVSALDKLYNANLSTAIGAWQKAKTAETNDPENPDAKTQVREAGNLVGQASDQLNQLNTVRNKLGLTLPKTATVQLVDRDGNTVEAPAAKVDELLGKGYKRPGAASATPPAGGQSLGSVVGTALGGAAQRAGTLVGPPNTLFNEAAGNK